MEVTQTKRLGKSKPNFIVHIPKREFFERGGAREKRKMRAKTLAQIPRNRKRKEGMIF